MIGQAVATEVRRRGFQVLRELTGHGVGRAIHEEPTVSNTFLPGNRQRLHEGLVIAVEPLIADSRSPLTRTRPDGWTIRTRDGGLAASCPERHLPGLAAHFEHTVMITAGRPLILTA